MKIEFTVRSARAGDADSGSRTSSEPQGRHRESRAYGPRPQTDAWCEQARSVGMSSSHDWSISPRALLKSWPLLHLAPSIQEYLLFLLCGRRPVHYESECARSRGSRAGTPMQTFEQHIQK